MTIIQRIGLYLFICGIFAWYNAMSSVAWIGLIMGTIGGIMFISGKDK